MNRFSWSILRLGGPEAGVRLVLVLLAAVFAIAGLRMTPEKAHGKAEARLAERMASGEAMRRTDVVAVWVPRGLLTGAGFLGLAALVWPRRKGGAERMASGDPQLRISRRHQAGLAVFLALLAVHAWPRMDYGLWSDEQQSVADSIVGEVETDRDGRPGEFRALPWIDTVFGYITPNNHVLYSIAARVVHSAHAPPETRSDPHHSVVLLRLAALLPALGAVVAVFWAAWRLAGPASAWMASLFLGLHPWWLRFATEVRGYALLVLLAALLLGAADRAMRTGRMRWWLACGLLQFLCLWTWPLAVHLIFWLNAGIIVALIAARRAGVPGAWRGWLSGSFIGAACAAPLLLPLLPQIRRYLNVMGGQTDRARWPMENISELLTGRRWTHPHHEPDDFFPNWDTGLAGGSMILLLTLLCIAGALVLWQQRDRRWLLLPLLAAPPALYAVSVLGDSIFHPWYTAPFLPGVCLLAGTGLAFLAGKCRVSLPLVTAGWACVLIWSTWWPRMALLEHPVESSREAAALINAPQNAAFANAPGEPLILVRSPHQLAIPTARRVSAPADIHAALAEAQRDGRDVFYYECLQGLLELSGSPLAACLADRALFTDKVILYGTNYERPIGIYRWTGNRQPGYPGPMPPAPQSMRP